MLAFCGAGAGWCWCYQGARSVLVLFCAGCFQTKPRGGVAGVGVGVVLLVLVKRNTRQMWAICGAFAAGVAGWLVVALCDVRLAKPRRAPAAPRN